MYTRLAVYASTALGSRSAAEDAVQEVFRIVCERIDDVMALDRPQGWVMNALKNTIFNRSRKQTRSSALVSRITSERREEASSQDALDPDLLYADIADTDDYKLMRRLADGGMTLAELADELGISLEACKKRVQRARSNLQKKFEKYRK